MEGDPDRNVFLPNHMLLQASPVCSLQRCTWGSSVSASQDYQRTSKGEMILFPQDSSLSKEKRLLSTGPLKPLISPISSPNNQVGSFSRGACCTEMRDESLHPKIKRVALVQAQG